MTEHLVGVAEAAELLGVSKQRINQLASEYVDFPDPVVALASGRVWRAEDIEAWNEAHGDRPKGRPRRKCPNCGARMAPATGHGVGARREGEPLPPITSGQMMCPECEIFVRVAGDPWGRGGEEPVT